MDAYMIYDLIKDMKDTGSSIGKADLLGKMAESEMGKFVLEWTYNPFITFGVKPAPTESANKTNMVFKPALVTPLLKKLASRELTGRAAELEIAQTMMLLDARGAHILFLILSKDLKCGIAATTINQIMPGLIPVFSVMRAHAYEEKRVTEWPVKGEFKLDGQRNTFLCKDDDGGFFTRSGAIVPALDFLVPYVLKAAKHALEEYPQLQRVLKRDGEEKFNFMLDGEAMMGLFSETGALRRKNADATNSELHLYDMMSFDDFDASGPVGDPLTVRRRNLALFVASAQKYLAANHEDVRDMIQIVPQYFINSHEEAHLFFEKATNTTLASYMARGDARREAELLSVLVDKQTGGPKMLEGGMLKKMDGLYDKKKTYGWMKMKAEETKDLFVTGAYLGNKHTKYETCLGGLDVDHDGVTVHVGGGFSDPERLALWDDYQHDIDHPTEEKVLIGRMIEVKFHEVTPDGSLRHPRFIRFRDDKAGEVQSKEIAAEGSKP